MEKSDSDEGKRDGNRCHNSVRVNAGKREKRLQHFRQILFAKITEREARQGDAELGRGKVSVQMGTNVFGENGARISFLGQRVELAAPNFNNGKLAGDKKPLSATKIPMTNSFNNTETAESQ